jgi:ribosome-associated toxin RatA of RatAB toxin-antitoxin module
VLGGRWLAVVAGACWATLPGAAVAGVDAAALFGRGPVVLVEEDADGKFQRATAMIVIDAPPDRVFEVLRDMERYRQFMPKVIRSDVTPHPAGDGFDVRLVYDIPGPDTDYTARMVVDPVKREVRGTWLRDDLRGSSWEWRVEAHGEGQSLLLHSLRVKNFSPLLRQVEDDQQTVTLGVNVSSALVTVKALKRRSEQQPQARR